MVEREGFEVEATSQVLSDAIVNLLWCIPFVDLHSEVSIVDVSNGATIWENDRGRSCDEFREVDVTLDDVDVKGADGKFFECLLRDAWVATNNNDLDVPCFVVNEDVEVYFSCHSWVATHGRAHAVGWTVALHVVRV